MLMQTLKKSFSKRGAVLALMLVTTGGVKAAVVVEENFNFSGNLTANGWTAVSGGGTAVISTGTGLNYTGLPSSGVGNSAIMNSPITSGATGEDLRKAFPSGINSGAIYTSFLINLTSATAGGDYFFFFCITFFCDNRRGVQWQGLCEDQWKRVCHRTYKIFHCGLRYYGKKF